MIIEYIKSSVDIILNLKFEEIEKRLLEKNGSERESIDKRSERVQNLISNDSSQITNRSGHGRLEGGPPEVYEELI